MEKSMQVEFDFKLVGHTQRRVWSDNEACHHCVHGHICYKRRNLLRAAVLTKITIDCNDYLKDENPKPISME